MTDSTDDADDWAQQLNEAADDGGGCPEMFREAFEMRADDDDSDDGDD